MVGGDGYTVKEVNSFIKEGTLLSNDDYDSKEYINTYIILLKAQEERESNTEDTEDTELDTEDTEVDTKLNNLISSLQTIIIEKRQELIEKANNMIKNIKNNEHLDGKYINGIEYKLCTEMQTEEDYLISRLRVETPELEKEIMDKLKFNSFNSKKNELTQFMLRYRPQNPPPLKVLLKNANYANVYGEVE